MDPWAISTTVFFGELERIARVELDAIGVHRAARDMHIRAPSRRKREAGVFRAVEEPAVDAHILMHDHRPGFAVR